MGLMNFLLESFKLLAWPLFALGYPVFASVRAIETNSKFHTKKLIYYWVCFSFILLFEHAFAGLLEWLPAWLYIKLLIVGYLSIPRFDGSVHVYNHFLHPCLSVKLLDFLDWFIKLKALLKQHKLLAELKRGAKETKIQAAENSGSLTASKAREITPDFALLDNRTDESMQIKEMVTAPKAGGSIVDILAFKEVQMDHSCGSCQVRTTSKTYGISDLRRMKSEDASDKLTVSNQTSIDNNPTTAEISAALISKGMSTSGGCRPEEQHCKDVQKNWICSVCHETAANVTEFISHLQGKQHLDACEKLKAKDEMLKNKVSSASSTASASSNTGRDQPEKLQPNSTPITWTCAVCEVTVTSKMDLICHFKGRRHEHCLEKLKAKIEASKTNTGAEENGMAGSNLPHKPHMNVKIPWTCHICEATIKGEASLVSHLQGARHTNACEKYRRLIQKAKRDASPASVGKKSNSSEDADKHKSGNLGSRYVEVKNSRWRCTVCNVSCSSEGNMAGHLNGSKHLAKIQELHGAGNGRLV